jgi:ribosomal protein S18 acetylase RimI-like enzyme
VYVFWRVDPLHFEIRNLAVTRACRRVGLGRWMLGHAIGLAESRGARVIDVPCNSAAGFFAGSGFVANGGGQRLTLTPE